MEDDATHGLGEFLTVAEVADLLRLNPQTVRNWIDAGKLPAVRVGRRVRIKRADIDAIVQTGYTGGRASVSTDDPAYTAGDFWGGVPHPSGDFAAATDS